MKAIGKILLQIIATIFVFIIIIASIFIYITKYRITDVAEYKNEKNNYKILFQAVGEPEWPFGKTKVKVTLLNSNNKEVESFEEFISDDGATARESNIKINWNYNYVEVFLIGGEQEDSIHKINYK